MDVKQRDLINIIYCAITGEELPLSQGFDFETALKIAKRHSIAPLFYYGVLNCKAAKNHPLVQELFFLTCKNISVSEKQMYELSCISSAFDEAQVDYMPLKGTLLKTMYPKAEMRTMSDADILIRTEQYDKIKPIMQRLGYTEVKESNHELIWNKSGLHIELHKRLIPSYNEDYYEYFGDGWRLAKVREGTRYSMTDEDQMVYLFTHFAKHYRDAGIGLKHIVDLWIYRINKPELDEDYIKAELKKLRLYDFYTNIINTLAVWFKKREPDSVTDFITKIIFNSGVYGTHQAHVLSDAVKVSQKMGNSQKVKRKKYLELVFLPYSDMCVKYRFLKKQPFLLPFMWIYRIVEAIFFKRGSIKAQQDDLTRMSAKNIDNYHKALNFVGLDFNFKE